MFCSVKFKSTPFIMCLILSAFGIFAAVNSQADDSAAYVNTTAQSVQSVDVPIVMYHAVSDVASIQGEYVISSKEFESDLQYLAKNNYTTVFVEDLVNFVSDSAPLPEKPVVLTFDDGYYNNYLYVYPLLQKYNCKATISPIAYYSELYTEVDDVSECYSHCTWSQLKEMSESGLVEIANHTYNLHACENTGRKGIGKLSGESSESYISAISQDIETAQKMLEENTGKRCDVFAYPFGIYCDESKDILKSMGFKAALTCNSGINTLTVGETEDLYELKRIIRPHNSGLDI